MTIHSKFFHRLMRGEDDSLMFAFRHLDEFIHRFLHDGDDGVELVSLEDAESEAGESSKR